MDINNKMKGVVYQVDENKYKQLISNGVDSNKAIQMAIQTAIIFKEDSQTHEVINFDSYSTNAKETKLKEISMKARSQGIDSEVTSYFSSDPRAIDSLDRAVNHKEYITVDQREKEIDKTINKVTNNKTKKAAVTVLTTAAIAALAACGAHKDASEEKVVNTEVETNTDDYQGYGFYRFDLSNMEDMTEYQNHTEILNAKEVEAKYGIQNVSQKDRALLRLNILENFNGQLTAVDGKTELPYGLTIEQLIGIDAYANSNIYEAEDYVKNFGLYNFGNVIDDFQQATLNAGACLANPSVDGTALADIFLDEAVKENYLKQLDYLKQILNAKTDKEQKKYVNEYVEFLKDCSIDQTSDEYLDYDQHPGMAFVTTSVVNAINYHNIVLDKAVVSDIIIIGTDDVNGQSKINSICSDAQSKIDAAIDLVNSLEVYMPMNYNTMIDNEKEMELAEIEGREPRLKVLYQAELDTLIREVLCDQQQINELTNKTLEKEGKLVTIEDQKAILANAVNIQRQLLNAGGGYYKDAKTAWLASQLLKPGDTVEITETGVAIDEAELEAVAPDQAQAARDSLGLIDGRDQAAANQEIANQQNAQSQQDYEKYMEALKWSTEHGFDKEIPGEYKDLDQAALDALQQTIDAKDKTSEENKYSGGEITITVDPSIDISNISTDPNPTSQTQSNTQASVWSNEQLDNFISGMTEEEFNKEFGEGSSDSKNNEGNIQNNGGDIQDNAGNAQNNAGDIQDNAGNAQNNAGDIQDNAGNAQDNGDSKDDGQQFGGEIHIVSEEEIDNFISSMTDAEFEAWFNSDSTEMGSQTFEVEGDSAKTR